MQGLGQYSGQEVLAQQRQHLTYLDVGTLEPTQFGDEASRLAPGESGLTASSLFPAQALDRAVKSKGTACTQACERNGEAAAQATAFEFGFLLTHTFSARSAATRR